MLFSKTGTLDPLADKMNLAALSRENAVNLRPELGAGQDTTRRGLPFRAVAGAPPRLRCAEGHPSCGLLGQGAAEGGRRLPGVLLGGGFGGGGGAAYCFVYFCSFFGLLHFWFGGRCSSFSLSVCFPGSFCGPPADCHSFPWLQEASPKMRHSQSIPWQDFVRSQFGQTIPPPPPPPTAPRFDLFR